ncbi:uncharacterized metal-dependent hydrolase YcfH-like [Mercenaria mercenaria]|uniref:uncharacterized metal-dependent hydrolase YcfH-like n=1 Tax=Mercenaria mercenaria TaxID=6596 RepID=UPI00234EF2E3|nr:uncharacterized metal-dependent hydrolase YcfH-like [Mercenaria mercenaria]
MKVHAFKYHVHGIFDERLRPDDEQVLRGRRNALNQATRWLLGRPASLDELVTFVVIQRMFSTADNTEVTPRQEEAMAELCRFLRIPVPDNFVLEPANSPGCLIHWKAVLLIAASLDADERQYWQDYYPVPENAEIQPQVEAQVRLPAAFDSHFHLDRTLRKLNINPAGNLDDIINCVPVDADKKVNLVGTVAVYCDPRSYPSEQCLLDLPEDMTVAIEFHPKHAKNSVRSLDVDTMQLPRLLQNSRVKALGEIGLDHSEPIKYWSYQVELLEKVLPLLEDHHILIIHCRGMKGNCGTEAFLLLLHFLQQKVRQNHPIHLHCFTGNQYVIQRWLEIFPRTYFGFTNLVESFNPEQVAALRSIDENRLLLESDAPYFPSMGSEVSSPSQIFAAAKSVATHRQMTVERVLEITVANAVYLYRGQSQ